MPVGSFAELRVYLVRIMMWVLTDTRRRRHLVVAAALRVAGVRHHGTRHHSREGSMRGIRIGSIALSALVAVGIGGFVSTHAVAAQPAGPARVADQAQQASTHMTVTPADYSIKLETQSVPAGDVTFD